LLEEASIEGAKGVLVNITGGTDLTLFEVNEASTIIREAADDDANIIFGAVIDERMQNQMKITVIATGFDRQIIVERSIPLLEKVLQPNLHSFANRFGVTGLKIDGNQGMDRRDIPENLDTPTFIRKKAD